MVKYAGSVARYPARALFAWFLGLIVVGAVLLNQPFCRHSDAAKISRIDAIFTATSASCVTGLTVRSSGNDFSFWGQLVILILIQLGGLGIMTVATLVSLAFGGGEELRQRVAIAETLGQRPTEETQRVLVRVIVVTLVIELSGALILLLRRLFEQPEIDAAWWALFHAISAFCNAGFALADNNLEDYHSDPIVNLTIIALIVLGGIGFPVISDVLRNRKERWPDCWDRLQLHSKLALIGTVGLLVFGAVLFLILEWHNALAHRPWGTRLLASMFQSTTPRTAGFNTVPIATLTDITLFVLVLLMMVGACPCSTGGGYKVSTLMILVLHAWSRFRGDARITVFRRTIAPETVGRAIAGVLLYASVATVGLGALLVVEQRPPFDTAAPRRFLELMFEVVSAQGTVGLSTGVTPTLSTGGKWIIIALMFLGRVGPLSVVLALSRQVRHPRVEYPKEEVLIG
jgi:trk system potassium uptake protein TrkH